MYETAARRAIPAPVLSAKELRDGDLILEGSGGSPDQPVGRVSRFVADDAPQGRYVCSNFFRVLRPDTSVVVPAYAELVLQRLWELPVIRQLQRQTTGIINLDFARYLRLGITLPSSLAEQERVIESTNAHGAALRVEFRRLTRQHDMLAALRRALMTEAQAAVLLHNDERWTETTLGACFDIASGASPPRDCGGVTVYGANGPIGSTAKPNFARGYTVGRVGAVGQVHRVDSPVWASDNTLTATPREEICDFDFAEHLLLDADLPSLARQSVQPLVTQTQLRTVPTRLPPAPQQRRIAEILEGNSRLAKATSSRLTRIETLGAALRDDLLSGRVRT